MKLDIDKLEALAKPACLTKWTYDSILDAVIDESGYGIVEGSGIVHGRYIAAANPQTILALCERVRKLEALRVAAQPVWKLAVDQNEKFDMGINPMHQKIGDALADLEHSK